ncbi:MAG: 4Fe-4S ferredoxin [Promethearchaeota archaeon CR_4]|nr:MAG: 4Fe-4S ferredoxin [Candidatus Lokiarchaeota archaeon CR_4]
MGRPVWFVELIKRTFSKRFIIGKMMKIPVVGSFIKKMVFGGDDIIFLPKDYVVLVQQSVVYAGQMVLPSHIVEYFIEEASFHWVMNFCICRSASKCKDYPIELGCLFLGEAARGINPQFGRPVSKEEALAHVRRCRQLGLVHLIGRNKLDELWLGVKPGEKLLSVCNCCPCCCLYKVLPYLPSDIGGMFTKMPGVIMNVDEHLCQGCGICTQGVCFTNAIHVFNKKAVISNECRGCGRCVEICPQKAISLTITDPTFLETTITHISHVVDVK